MSHAPGPLPKVTFEMTVQARKSCKGLKRLLGIIGIRVRTGLAIYINQIGHFLQKTSFKPGRAPGIAELFWPSTLMSNKILLIHLI